MSSQFQPKHNQSTFARLKLEELESRSVPSTVNEFAAQTGGYVENEIIVQFDSAPVNTPLSSSLQDIGNSTYDVYLQSGVSVSQAVSYYSALKGVVYAQPDYTMTLQGAAVTPNNPNYSNQWSLSAINAPQAWGVTTGNSNVVVAVIDTGVDYNQPDLVNNLWHNTDGSVGWNFINNDNNPYDYNGHGTAVAGIIGADGNSGIGVAGVDWHVKLMALEFMDSTGSGSTSNAAAAIYWAVQHGATIINASWGGTSNDTALASAIAYAQQHGVIVVTASGDNGTNNDTSAFYPADYQYNNLVAVAATDQNGNLASYSNYGPNSVALAAPGSSILTTTPNDTYTYYTGTSMAAAEVTGAMALVWGEHPSWTYTEVIDAVLNSVDPLSGLSGKVETGGQLDLYKAVTYGQSTTAPSTASSITGLTLSATSVSEYKAIGTVVGTFSASEAGSGNTFTYSLVGGTGSGSNLFSIVGNKLETAGVFDYSTQSSYTIEVQATDKNGNTYDETFTIDIVNVAAIVRNGKTLTITGTSGNDVFTFNGGTVNTFTLNGVTYAASSVVIGTFVFVGGGGADTADIAGAGAWNVGMTPTGGEAVGSMFTLIMRNISHINAYGTAADAAYLYDGPGSNEFVGTSSYSDLQGANYFDYVAGFGSVSADATSGSNDTAYLYDGAGDNTFVGSSNCSYLEGTNYLNYICGFQAVYANESSGSYDVAYLFDAAGSNTFVGTSSYSYMQGGAYLNYVSGFQYVWANATSGNNDTAYLYEGSGTNVFYGEDAFGYVDGNGLIYGMQGFTNVYLYSTGSVVTGPLYYSLNTLA
jgi:subtilisin family serine protease